MFGFATLWKRMKPCPISQKVIKKWIQKIFGMSDRKNKKNVRSYKQKKNTANPDL